MSGSLTTLVVLVTLLHVAALVVMIIIRVRRTEGDSPTGESVKVTPCAVCGAPSTHLGYDGLDPDAQRDPYTGRSWSTDTSHYVPMCAAH